MPQSTPPHRERQVSKSRDSEVGRTREDASSSDGCSDVEAPIGLSRGTSPRNLKSLLRPPALNVLPANALLLPRPAITTSVGTTLPYTPLSRRIPATSPPPSQPHPLQYAQIPPPSSSLMHASPVSSSKLPSLHNRPLTQRPKSLAARATLTPR